MCRIGTLVDLFIGIFASPPSANRMVLVKFLGVE